LIHPIRADVVFQRFTEESETAGGILIPDVAKRPGTEAEVLACGPQCEEVKVGDKVIVDLWQGTQVTYGDSSYWIISEDRVGATVG
tara:strand:- start:9741 stop:9998 length:258 start_codon:yes stop_codon:yes gene_type:complete